MATQIAKSSSGELVVDFFGESLANLLVVAFPKSSSKNFAFALSLAMGASKYGIMTVDGKPMHVACFARTQADAARASTFLSYASGWKGTLIFSAGKLVQSSYQVSQVLSCYLESCSCRDSRAHCQTIIDDPFSREVRDMSFSISIRLVENPPPKQEVKIDRYSFPCKLLYPYFRFQADHPASHQDQIQAAGVQRGCDVCPHFNPDDFRVVGEKTVLKDFFE